MDSKKKLIIAIISLLSCALWQTTHADPYYKWIDEQGATHYTQTPPPQKTVKKIDINTHVPADSASEIKNLNTETSKTLKNIDADDKATDKAKAAAAADAARRNKNGAECQQLHSSLALLQSGQRLRTNDANGDRSYVTEDQKATQIQQETAQIQKDCP